MAQPTAADQPRQMTMRDRLAVFAMFLGALTLGIDAFIISPLLNDMATSLAANPNQIAFAVSSYALSHALFAPILSPLGDRFRPQRVAVVGLLLFSGATVILALQTTLFGLYGFRALAGFGGAMFMPNVQTYLTRTWDRRLSTKLIGMVIGGMSIAIALGVPVGAFVANRFSWQQSFIGIAGIGFLGAAILFIAIGFEPYRSQPTLRSFTDYVKVITVPGIRYALLGTLLWMAAFTGVYTFLGALLQHELAITTAQTGAYLMVYGTANFIASATSGWINPLFGAPHRPVLLFGVLSWICVLGLTGLPLTPPLTMALLAIWALGQGYAINALITLVVLNAGVAVPTALALNSSTIYIGTAIGAALFAKFSGHAIWSLGYPHIVIIGLAMGSSVLAAQCAAQGQARANTPSHA